ncbi:MAG: hypothetical protein LBM02_08765 [Lachnospiraceae bacterium]|jgi:hypothetical protein|nr:hypothetical protein [Lachnospiraceae bacterium]
MKNKIIFFIPLLLLVLLVFIPKNFLFAANNDNNLTIEKKEQYDDELKKGDDVFTLPTADKVTYNSIVIHPGKLVEHIEMIYDPMHSDLASGLVEKKISSDQRPEYAISYSNKTSPLTGWQTNYSFANLEKDQTYYIWMRSKKDDKHNAGVPEVSKGIKTFGNIQFNPNKIKLSYVNKTYQVDSSNIGGNLNITYRLSDTKEYTERPPIFSGYVVGDFNFYWKVEDRYNIYAPVVVQSTVKVDKNINGKYFASITKNQILADENANDMISISDNVSSEIKFNMTGRDYNKLILCIAVGIIAIISIVLAGRGMIRGRKK